MQTCQPLVRGSMKNEWPGQINLTYKTKFSGRLMTFQKRNFVLYEGPILKGCILILLKRKKLGKHLSFAHELFQHKEFFSI